MNAIARPTLRVLCAVIALGAALPAAALECPVAPAAASEGAIRLAPDRRATYRARLAADDPVPVIHDLIAELRERAPTADRAAIANYVIALECPIVAASGQGPADETARMKHFSALVHDELAGLPRLH